MSRCINSECGNEGKNLYTVFGHAIGMMCDDCGSALLVASDRVAELEAIVRDLAHLNEPQNVAGFCPYCDEKTFGGGEHAESCAWVRARELTGDT